MIVCFLLRDLPFGDGGGVAEYCRIGLGFDILEMQLQLVISDLRTPGDRTDLVVCAGPASSSTHAHRCHASGATPDNPEPE